MHNCMQVYPEYHLIKEVVPQGQKLTLSLLMDIFPTMMIKSTILEDLFERI